MDGIKANTADCDHFEPGKILKHRAWEGEASPGIQEDIGIGESTDFFFVGLRAICIECVMSDGLQLWQERGGGDEWRKICWNDDMRVGHGERLFVRDSGKNTGIPSIGKQECVLRAGLSVVRSE